MTELHELAQERKLGRKLWTVGIGIIIMLTILSWFVAILLGVYAFPVFFFFLILGAGITLAGATIYYNADKGAIK